MRRDRGDGYGGAGEMGGVREDMAGLAFLEIAERPRRVLRAVEGRKRAADILEATN